MPSRDNNDVVISSAMFKIGDKITELIELLDQQQTQLQELARLMGEWSDVLLPKDVQ